MPAAQSPPPNGGIPSSDAQVVGALARSTGTQLVARAVHWGLNVAMSLALVSYLGPAGYGDYVFAVTMSALVGLLSDFGLTRIAVREMARSEADAATVLGTSILARLGLVAVGWMGTQLALELMGARPEVRAAVAVATLVCASEALLSVVAVFHVRIALQYEALVTVVGQALETGLVLLLISWRASLLQIVAAPVLSWSLAAGLAALIAYRRFGARVRVDPARILVLVRDAAPVGLTLMLVTVHLKLDNILLGVLATPSEVGLYGAAFKPIEYLLLALAVLLNPMFPLLARWHGNDPSHFRTLYQRGMEGVLAVTLPIAIVVMLTADAVVALLYPTDFAPSAAPMRLLGVALVLMILNAWHGFTLLAAGHQRITLAYDAAALAINAGLSIALIPMLSILGPAVGSVAACLLAFGCSLLATWRLAGVGPSGRGVAASVGAGLAFGASLWLLRSVGAPWPLALLLAGTIYPAWLLLFGVIRLSELRRLLRGDRSATAVIPGVPTP